ncbi:MAG: hypothetical protein DRG76_04245 [Deltaproteobacteria bacterium]|nr:MAG: hypothetical protein DRG76_04245 [Deltaproteobacteria bacterium]
MVSIYTNQKHAFHMNQFWFHYWRGPPVALGQGVAKKPRVEPYSPWLFSSITAISFGKRQPGKTGRKA